MSRPLVTPVPPRDDVREPAPGVALCLSGGGYRAMLFHVGALWRLNELGLLRGIARVSSVSGGSIAAGMLGLAWGRLGFQPGGMAARFVDEVVTPLRKLAGRTIDAGAIAVGAILPLVDAADRIEAAYRDHLFGDATLQDLPDDQNGPRFVINASNVQSGALWRFSRAYMADYRVGEMKAPRVPLALAVAASSAFPPFLSPVKLALGAGDIVSGPETDLGVEPYTRTVVLTDGGVYDNLGLETAWKRYQTLLVSDGGGALEAEPAPKEDWARHAYRVLQLIDSQVRALRKRQLIDAFRAGERRGTYWGVRTNVADYDLPSALPCPLERTLELAATPTRLKALDDDRQERLINWGFAVCDAAVRRHIHRDAPAPPDWPYPRGV
jgi:NTE family protein